VRILTRYILREVISYALLGGALFTFVLLMRYLPALLELAVRGAAGPADLLRVILDLLPNLLTLTLPMGVLVGTLLGLSRLASDSEVTAMRASGMGAVSFVRIVGVFAVIAWVAGLANSFYFAPRAAASLLHYEAQFASSEETFNVQPRVFYEDFKSNDCKDCVLFVQEVEPVQGASVWKNVFLADVSQPASPHVITAREAYVTATQHSVTMHLSDGTRHDTILDKPDQYDIYTFADTDLPVQSDHGDDAHLSRRDTPMQSLPAAELWRQLHTAHDPRPYRVQFQQRLAFPAACLVLMLVGVPLGLSSKRGGKSTGFVATIGLVFLYYFLSSVGIALAQQGKLPPWLGVWSANLLFAIGGVLLLVQLSRGTLAFAWLSAIGAAFATASNRLMRRSKPTPAGAAPTAAMQRLRRTLRSRFPLILDEYVMRSYMRNLALVLATLIGLFLIFTFFELIGDIIRFRTPLVTVGEYLVNLIPYILYNVTPLCALVATLITFGTLSRTSELTAMKANGMSLYRVVAPVMLIAVMLSVGLFSFDEAYLPAANRRQEALRSVIKGKPAQTFQHPDRKWMSGHADSKGAPRRIFYYQFFDADQDIFANISVFEFEPGTFALGRRITAESAHWSPQAHAWIFENGWVRTFQGSSVADYRTFGATTFPAIHETPSYFKKEDRPSQEMSYSELRHYIADLSQSGFDTTRLRVQLNRKLAYPLITLMMTILAVPFALSAGKRGSLAGMATALSLAIGYWVIAGLFENLGNVNSLPALVAAWSPDLIFGITGAYYLLKTPT
jgi:LPS export ABC transporter permease LptG/LPS export ABC transporter permease LptF